MCCYMICNSFLIAAWSALDASACTEEKLGSFSFLNQAALFEWGDFKFYSKSLYHSDSDFIHHLYIRIFYVQNDM